MEKLKSRREVLDYMKELIKKEQWSEVQRLRPRLAKYKSYSSDYLFKSKVVEDFENKEQRAKVTKQQAIDDLLSLNV